MCTSLIYLHLLERSLIFPVGVNTKISACIDVIEKSAVTETAVIMSLGTAFTINIRYREKLIKKKSTEETKR